VTNYLRSLGPWRSMNSKWCPMLKREVTRLVINSLWLKYCMDPHLAVVNKTTCTTAAVESVPTRMRKKNAVDQRLVLCVHNSILYVNAQVMLGIHSTRSICFWEIQNAIYLSVNTVTPVIQKKCQDGMTTSCTRSSKRYLDKAMLAALHMSVCRVCWLGV